MMKKVLKIFTNKYVITAVAFIAWIAFFDQNDYFTMRQRRKELNAVKGNITYLNSEITRMTNERNDLLINPQKLEAYARENYRMKRQGEDVYVIENGHIKK